MRECSIQKPKLKLSVLDRNNLGRPEWCSMFVATLYRRHIADSEKMSHLKTLLTGKPAVSGMGYSGQFYEAAWEIWRANLEDLMLSSMRSWKI